MQGDLFCQHWITVLSRAAITQFTLHRFHDLFNASTTAKHLAGAVFPIYCWEHLKKTQQKSLKQHSPAKREEADDNAIPNISNRNKFTSPDSVISLPWTESLSSAFLLWELHVVMSVEKFHLGSCFSSFKLIFMFITLVLFRKVSLTIY